MSSMRSASSRTSTRIASSVNARGEQILEPAGRGDEMCERAAAFGLLDEADAAVDGGDPQRAGVRDRAELVDDLGRELAGRREHERRRAAGLGG